MKEQRKNLSLFIEGAPMPDIFLLKFSVATLCVAFFCPVANSIAE